MNEAFGAEESYVRKIIGQDGPGIALIFRYGMLASEFSNILNDPGLSASEVQALSGLIGKRQLLGLNSAQLACLPIGTLTAVEPNYLNLGLCCGQKFLHDLNLTVGDAATFKANGVAEIRHGSINYAGLGNYSLSNSIASWGLSDNGVVKATDVMLERTKHASKVLVYDRFMGSYAAQAMDELLSALAVGGGISATWEILIGSGTDGLSDAALKNRFVGYFTDPGLLTVSYSGKPKGTKLHAHDRYVQIDESYTFVLTAGLACFCEAAGRNRASSIELHDLFVGYTSLKIKRASDGVVVEVKY
jgi:hypothetical protein